jgi:O-antigen ligase
MEINFNTHFQTIIGYAQYNLYIHDIIPSGNHGLTWTFEAQGGKKRFASIFANPLENSATMLIFFSIAVFYLTHSKYYVNRAIYLSLSSIAIMSIIFAYSRAALVSLILLIFFISIILKYYRLIFIGIVLTLIPTIYIIFFAPEEIRYFVWDTISFTNSSSLTHLLEWVEAIDSIIVNPMGIGLASSGNAGGVVESLKVGGENQFLIIGVQLGVIGLIIYLLMIFYSIFDSWSVYNSMEQQRDKIIPFIAATSKFGLLLPLFTANAETYLFPSLFSWWMVGFSQKKISK